MSKNIVVMSNNEGKIREIKSVLKDFNVLSLKDLNLDIDVEETGATFEENAILKVEALKDKYDYVLADDSGLEISALDNQPGVYSARFLGHDTPYEIKNKLVLEKISECDDRGARFTSVIALSDHGVIHLFKGVLNGEISREVRGTGGFGYNPIFIPEGFHETLAEISDDERDKITHRAKALESLKEYMKNE